MQILNEGNKTCSKWWHGLMLTCPTCGRTVKLEHDDYNRVEWIEAGPHAVSVFCMTCRDTMHAKSPNE